MKQAVVSSIKNDLHALSAAKKKGRKVGRLKFKSEVNSINLKQYGSTHEIKDNKIKIQGMKQLLKVHGLEQLDGFENLELANAKLLRKPSGLYIKLTIYATEKDYKLGGIIGIDFNVSDKKQIVCSNGLVLGQRTSKKLDELTKQKKLDTKRKQSGSKNKEKERKKFKKKEEQRSNKKKDYENKVFGYIRTFNVICIQDDDIKGWMGNHGKSIERSALGRIKFRIEDSLTPYMVDQFFPSTKTCSRCKSIKAMSLLDRIFECPVCGLKLHRDVNSACNIEDEALFDKSPEWKTPMEYREVPVEISFAKSVLQDCLVTAVA
jgi:putative transposase